MLLLVAGIGLLVPTFVGTASADPSASDWERLRMCESSNRYDVVADNGHYGAYQFDLPTWRSVGGTGLPSDASPAEQDQRALALWRKRGWQPWTCARTLGLGTTPAAPAGPPAWPGKVWVQGDCDPALRVWQLQMNRWGYDFQGTGCYYEKTRTAVLELQRANGLTPSGKLGPRTWQAAWDGAAPVRVGS
ncbi:transglycosylase family protein [Pseudonocardia sp. N23]|uniref:transglycosylase family protein n=1 Tax=Pseudonocardia sp. N23 TaxID=1987376 RepID=UPI000BFC74E1|nr:transglycosylase family protein [Pseudonocardia sp. N23]